MLCARYALVVSAALAACTTGCSRVVLSTDDAIVRADGRVTLVANVEYEQVRGVRLSLADVDVRFRVNGRTVGRGQTDDDGRATFETTVAPDTSEFEVIIKRKGARYSHHGRVFHWTPDRTIVAVDIDETVSDTSYRVLLLHDEDNKSDPLADSSATLSQLARDFQVVYLTGRPRFLWEKTRRWLDRHEFPAGPLVTAPSLRQCILQGIFKRVELAELRKTWPGALIGIGDRGVDINAYRQNGMLTLLVGGNDAVDPSKNVYRFGKWVALGEFCNSNHAVLSNPERLEAALRSKSPFRLPGQGSVVVGRGNDPVPVSSAGDTK